MIVLIIILGAAFGEIYLSIRIGQAIGAFKTVMIMLGVAVVGLLLAQLEAFALVKRLEREYKANGQMTDTAIELLFVVCGAILFILPGFITDALAFLFILPPTRAYFTNRVTPAFRHRIEDIVEKKRLELSSKQKP